MQEAMTWILMGTAILGAFALALLNAWLLLKIVLSSLTRGPGHALKANSTPADKRVRN